MHFCYILINETRKHTYVGYTVSPLKRLRQHNGEITGGARYTKRHGPNWSFVAIIACPMFDNHRALSLEWHMKPHGRKSKLYAMQDPVLNRIALLKKALELPKFQDAHTFWIHVPNDEYRNLFTSSFSCFGSRVEIV